MVLPIIHSCNAVSACCSSHIVSGCHVILLLCLVQEGSHADAITITPSQQQEQEQVHNQPAMNDEEDAITTRTTL